ncbi:MAG: hypothetical protein CMH83_20200 [Nocardioides sp.]|nr:hypothetical protein [Nocardioides sp.]
MALLLTTLVLLAGGVAVGAVQATRYYGGGFYDEWYCVQGEAPATSARGGSTCYPEGEALPKGWTFDPLGNRPFDCGWRHGWQPVERLDADAGEGSDCARTDEPLPPGYVAIED